MNKKSYSPLILLGFCLLVLLQSCSSNSPRAPTINPYESAGPSKIAKFKRVRLPLQAGTQYEISQGAFGRQSHLEKGNEYSWDFDVPIGTAVVAAQDGTVIDVWEPAGGTGCDAKYSQFAHNIKIQHDDGTVAQYVHITSQARVGDVVREGEIIATTSLNGFICKPQLHFGIYRSKDRLYNSARRETIPVAFDGLPPPGLATVGSEGVVPYEVDSEAIEAEAKEVEIDYAKLLPNPISRADWLLDFEQLEKIISEDYPNLDSQVEAYRINLIDLDQKTRAKLNQSASNADSAETLKDFIGRFKDPHFHLELEPPKPAAEKPVSFACPKPFKSRPKNFYFPFPTPRDSGFSGLKIQGNSFAYTTMAIKEKTIGFIRIPSFDQSNYPNLCADEWAKYHAKHSNDCDKKCEDTFENEILPDRILSEFSKALDALKAAHIDALVLDITDNGGGTDWVGAVMRMLTLKPITCGQFGFIRHPHWTEHFVQEATELRAKLLETNDTDKRKRIQMKLVQIEKDRKESKKKCVRPKIWYKREDHPSCSPVVKHPVLDCAPETDYLYVPGSYSGSLYILVNNKTASASEDLVSRYKDSGVAKILGEKTVGAGCGYTNGGLKLKLEHSGLGVKVPDCARYMKDGTNEVRGLAPDVPLPLRDIHSVSFTNRLQKYFTKVFYGEQKSGKKR